MKRLIVIGVLFLVGCESMPRGEDYWSVGILGTIHSDWGYEEDDGSRHEFNDTHPIVGYRHSSDYAGYIFRNSYRDVTVTAGKHFTHSMTDSLELDAYVGAATGYPNTPVIGWVGVNCTISEGLVGQLKVAPRVVMYGIERRF